MTGDLAEEGRGATMDPEAFLDIANQVSATIVLPNQPLPQVTKLKMYPYFDLAHAALCCLAVRDDLANGEKTL